MSEYYILSSRKTRFTPSQGCLIEFEDVLINCCNGTLITPDFSLKKSGFIGSLINLNPSDVISLPPKKVGSDRQILILSCSPIWDCGYLYHIPKWRKRFDIVCAYIFDPFLPRENFTFSKFSRFRNLVNSLDCLFLPMTGSLQQFTALFQVPVKIVPMACDILKFGGCKTKRHIDIIGYGRQLQKHNDILEATYNTPKSQRIYYHTNHQKIDRINDFYQNRRFFWHILRNSHIALAYDGMVTSPSRFNFSFIAQRWFECLAVGCVIVGRKPSCPEANALLSWENATIEVPEDDSELIPFMESLLEDQQYLQSIQNRNYINALNKHDWRYRITELLNYFHLSLPEALQQSLQDLESTCNQGI